MRISSTGRAARLLILAALAVGACAGTPAPVAPPAPVAAEAPAPAFRPDGIAALEARMAAYVEDGAVKGIATRLVRGGEVISDVRRGIRRQADGAPVEGDTIWRIYSMSKPVTGVALLMLWEEGAFQLDDPVTKYFPEFEGLQVHTGLDAAGEPILVPAKRPATIRELMSHTAGFGYGLRGGDHVNDLFQKKQVFQSPTMEEMVTRVASIPLLHQPGEVWDYSIAVDLQGALIERLSGQTLGAFFETRLFAPLGMVDTGFVVPEADYDRFSDVWGWSEEYGVLAALPMPAFQYRADTVAFEGGGHGLVSTMDDYARFAGMLANGGSLGGVRILKPETVAMMATDVLPEGAFLGFDGTASSEAAGVGFGLNVGVILDPANARGFPPGAYMWGGAAGTWFWVDPANDLYFIGMVQRFGQGGPAFDARTDSAALVYGALKP
ncbi:MAG: serine hydrolase domain-containing protein [Hyphomonas sp.]